MRKISATEQKLSDWLIRDKYGGDRSADLSPDLLRLKKGEPTDYVIGWSLFLGCRIGLEERPLIPRPETEYWTEQAIGSINRARSPRGVRVLDIFAGSGCVGIAVLKHCPAASVDFVEKDKKLCGQIKKNCEQNEINPKRYRIACSDLFSGLDRSLPSKTAYDYVLANPPYVPIERREKTAKSVTDWEPHLALFAEDGGLAVIKDFLGGVKKHLKADSSVWLEFDSGQRRALSRLLQENGYCQIAFHKDQYGRFRYATFQLPISDLQ